MPVHGHSEAMQTILLPQQLMKGGDEQVNSDPLGIHGQPNFSQHWIKAYYLKAFGSHCKDCGPGAPTLASCSSSYSPSLPED